MTMLICEACDVLPAAFLCKADSASLCAACDESIHSANPLAGRHHRVPINTAPTAITTHVPAQKEEEEEEDDEEAVSWLLQNPFVKTIDEDYLGIEDYYYYHGPPNNSLQRNHGFSSSNSWQQNDFNVVPQKGFEDRPCVHLRDEADDDDGELFLSPSTVQMAPAQLSPMEREARVMRYREKKKTRRFEKTIRYASRKAYAETRPRIKGRFAKRDDARDDNEADEEADELLRSSSFSASYGVVPSVSLYS